MDEVEQKVMSKRSKRILYTSTRVGKTKEDFAVTSIAFQSACISRKGEILPSQN